MKPRPGTLFALLAPLALMVVPAQADIVVLTNGRTLKTTSYSAGETTFDAVLTSGGTLHLPLTSIDRVLEDEIVPPDSPEIERASHVFPHRSWRFSESSEPLFESEYDDLIIAAARKFDVDAALISAVIKAESDYQPRVVSRAGARGLMQLMPSTAIRFGVTDSFDPEANIYGGTHYLRWLLDTFDHDADLAVAAYNAGEGSIWKYSGIPPFRETINYVNRIARHFPTQSAGSSEGVPQSAGTR